MPGAPYCHLAVGSVAIRLKSVNSGKIEKILPFGKTACRIDYSEAPSARDIGAEGFRAVCLPVVSL
jgi:hypothetical protein